MLFWSMVCLAYVGAIGAVIASVMSLRSTMIEIRRREWEHQLSLMGQPEKQAPQATRRVDPVR